MKGLDAPILIAIVIAVIAGVLILYFLWAKGLLPWLSGVSEADCKSDFIKVCGGQLTWEDIQDKDKGCSIYFSGGEKRDLEACLNDPDGSEAACDSFCASFLGGG